MTPNDKTERFIPGEGDAQTALEHTLRYEFAEPVCRGRVVVDLACGDGYGASIVARSATSVIAIDIDDATIAGARARYSGEHSNIEFRTGDAHAIDLPDASADCVIAYEMIEHVARPDEVIREVRRVLRPDGVLIISTPNAPENPENLPGANPYHLHAFDQASFDELLASAFAHREYFGERVVGASLLWPLAANGRGARDQPTTSLAPASLGASYLVALAASSTASGDAVRARWKIDESGELIEERVRFWRDAREAYARELELAKQLERLRIESHGVELRMLDAGRSAIAAQAEVAELRSQLARVSGELESALERTAAEHEQAEYFRDEAIRLRESLESVVHSASWRVTKPLRRARGSDRPE